jgi:hypothetical protein
MQHEDRRTALIGFAGAAVAGAGLLLAACSKGEMEVGGEGSEGEVTANEDLVREHGILRRILIVYREVAPKLVVNATAVDAAALGNAAKLFQCFGERYHEQLLEEAHIFPTVRKAGGMQQGWSIRSSRITRAAGKSWLVSSTERGPAALA